VCNSEINTEENFHKFFSRIIKKFQLKLSCSGQIDCGDGSDEIDCMALELNECNPESEYRCRQGTCIPLQAAFDMFIDCTDASDEYRYVKDRGSFSTDFYCDSRNLPLCYEHFCGNNAFACGDGTCSYYLWSKLKCSTKRDLHYIQNILSTSKNDENSCWTFAICQLGFEKYFPNLTYQICSSSHCGKDIFFFPAEHDIAYPSVKFVYKTKREFSPNFINPDYICFDTFTCQNHPWPIVTISNMTCSSWNDVFNSSSFSKNNWDDLIISIRQIFASCLLPNKDWSNDKRLFNCGQSFFISKHRLNDGYRDCYDSNDEMKDRNICQLNLANRFQCKTSQTECIPRLFLMDEIQDCTDKSDESSFYRCASLPFEAGCKVKRGTLEGTTSFQFDKLCDGLLDYSENNITDEDNCPSSWLNPCYSSLTNCDHYWHCKNGRDELNCSSVQFNPCRDKEQFYCINETNEQFVCYSSELAGDGHADCVGAIDERVQGFCRIK
jgi:hypothetical protein